MNIKNLRRKIILFSLYMLLISLNAYAGNIDPHGYGSKYAWGENIGWINLAPSFGPGVTVTDTAVTGAAWAENSGWITMDSAYGGVVNDGNGNLSGYAWGENIGWINFGPANGGVTINIFTGKFSGWAWGENIGWINFELSTQAQYLTRTEWSVWQKDGDPANDWDADPDGDGIVNLDDPDADNDGLNNDAEYAMWGASWNTDIDGDGLYNLIDDDSDGDGFLDGEDAYPSDPNLPNESNAMQWIPLLLLE